MERPFSLQLRWPIRLWLFLAGPTRSYIICECICTCAITPHGPLHDLSRVQQLSNVGDESEKASLRLCPAKRIAVVPTLMHHSLTSHFMPAGMVCSRLAGFEIRQTQCPSHSQSSIVAIVTQHQTRHQMKHCPTIWPSQGMDFPDTGVSWFPCYLHLPRLLSRWGLSWKGGMWCVMFLAGNCPGQSNLGIRPGSDSGHCKASEPTAKAP